MVEIYDLPKGFEVPEMDFGNFNYKEHHAKKEKFLEDLKNFLKNYNPHEKEVGEIISWAVADGKAMYMVASLKPKVELVHLPLGDAWHYEDADLQTEARIRKKIAQGKALKEMFAKHKKKQKQ